MVKFLPGVAIGLGMLLIIGTAGSSDFYEQCRAAADCVAGEPMSALQMFTQLIIGFGLMVGGISIVNSRI